MKKYTGNFGKLAEQYDSLRPAYPKHITSLIYGAITSKKPLILDLGCGTGISTRQLAHKKSSVVIGCDIDGKMLKAALRYKKSNISYKRAAAEKLPFPDDKFDVVTSFIAFHWFMNKEAVHEIRRVLKPHGLFFVVQPRFASFQKDFRIMLEREIKQKIPRKYKIGNEIIIFLNKNGFQTKRYVVKSDVKYTLDEYVNLLKSYSLWNYVPKPCHKEMENKLRMHFRSKLLNGYIRNVKDIEIITAANL